MSKRTPGPWRLGKHPAVVVSDHPIGKTDLGADGGHDDVEYYGGHCICESVAKKADSLLLAAAPDLLTIAEVLSSKLFDSRNGSIQFNSLERTYIKQVLKGVGG